MTTYLDAAVKVGEYTGKDGKTKNKYQNIGTAFVHQDGSFSVKLEKWFNPAGALNDKGECWINFFAKKDSQQQSSHQQSKQNAYQSESGLQSDDVPW